MVTVEIGKLSDTAGAEILGLDLSKPLSSEDRDVILSALNNHHVLVFRNQILSKDQQITFTQQFGELEQHVGRLPDGSRYPIVHTVTNLDPVSGKPTTAPHTHGNYFWHTDKSYHAIPSLMTLLYAVDVPQVGGDTLFCNMHFAYNALSTLEKNSLKSLKAVHSWEASRRNTGNIPASEEQKRERPPVSHPLVRTHPETKKKSLYLGMHICHIEDMEAEKSKLLLKDLLNKSTIEKNIYRHSWRTGDLVIWDNRCLLHKADRNYDIAAHPRVLHRTVVRGAIPF
jgi:taurine dioxygenase